MGVRHCAAFQLLNVVWPRKRQNPDAAPQAFAPGTFYSPVPNAAELLEEPERSRIWPAAPTDPAGIDFRETDQLRLFERLARFEFPDPKSLPEPRYDPENDQFPPQDAALLHAMIRDRRPGRMIEIGCGWSTIVTAAAVSENQGGTELVCVDPYPRSFLSAITQVSSLRAEKVEHTPLSMFEDLTRGDVLFIDSSHVAKTGSDVVYLLLEVFPRVADGVLVHVHDIFWPNDYPSGWVRNGFGWNEQYLLQAFLVGQTRARIVAANQWMAVRNPDAVRAAFGDLALTGSSVWFELDSQAVQTGQGS